MSTLTSPRTSGGHACACPTWTSGHWRGSDPNGALPERLATATLAARLADVGSAARVLAEPVRFSVVDG
jgi:hypothetical protein